MQISVIAAISQNGVIGRDGHLPWHLSEDLRRFRRITTGHAVVMGRKNYEDIGRPLPDRKNYVLTRNRDFAAPGCSVCGSLDIALTRAEDVGETECFVIGGASVYRDAMPLATRMYITRVEAEVDGDVFFPEWGDGWKLASEQRFPADEKNDYPTVFQIWERNDNVTEDRTRRN